MSLTPEGAPAAEEEPRLTVAEPVSAFAIGFRDEGEAGESSGGVPLPPPPQSLDATGLSTSFLLELALKIIRYVELPTSEHVARIIGLPSAVTHDLIEVLKRDRLLDIVSSSSYDIASSYKLRLTERGEQRADEALERCRYAGAAPVTLEQYERVVGPQVERRWRPPLETIRQAYADLVLESSVQDFLERSLHSGRSVMIYGPSGNGKTHLLTEFVRHMQGEVLVPHSIYAYGQIIRIYDPLMHERVDNLSRAQEEQWDKRWVRIRRPGLLVGGELTEESLELGFDPVARFYQAPKHLKAQGGVLVVDDFGRQKISPSDLLNRWIMALERNRDNLLLRTGESIDIPFSVTLLFSTNLDPADLADAAYLRRIPYKIYVPPAVRVQFKQILRNVLREARLEVSEETLDDVVAHLAELTSDKLSGALPRDIVAIILDNAEHDGRPPTFDRASVELAYRQFVGTGVMPAPQRV